MISLDASTPTATIATQSAQLAVLLRQRRFAEALAAGQALHTQAPARREVLLYVAIAQRFLGQVADALNTLATLEHHHPGFSRLYEERGHCFVALKRAPQAIEAFRHAVTINNALPGSWNALEGLYRMTGQTADRAVAADNAATLRALPAEVVSATGLFLDGDVDTAESRIRAYLLQHGNQVEAMRLLARIGIARQVLDDAELLLAALLEMAPDHWVARAEYTEVLLRLQKYAEARRQVEQLLRQDPANRARYLGLQASALAGLGEHEQALNVYQTMLQGSSADAELHLFIAHALKTIGRGEAAIDSYRKALAIRPGYGDAYWSLANLKTYRFTDEELDQLRALQADPQVGAVDRYHLAFALGKALEDRGIFDESYRHYMIGNGLRHAENRYVPEVIETNTRQQIEVCTPEFFAVRRNYGSQAPDPIFIVGLPRSGSTLLEQILASHSQVEGTQELAHVQQIVAKLRGRDPDLTNPRYPRILADLTETESQDLAAQYLAAARSYRTNKPHFIDKMPNNFRHIGLIHLMLPRARIIDARREPMACCFGNLKQLFAKGQEFTYSVEDIARYYRTYLDLMQHWERVLTSTILRVHYEDVVDDLEGSVRRMLKFCNLEFEPQCIEYHRTSRSIRSASSEQVRQPIFRDGLDQWKHFEPWLAPLKAALGDALQRYRA